MSHNAFVPLQPNAATGGLFHCGSLGYVEQAADQELSVRAVLAHLGPHTQSQQDVVTQENGAEGELKCYILYNWALLTSTLELNT